MLDILENKKTIRFKNKNSYTKQDFGAYSEILSIDRSVARVINFSWGTYQKSNGRIKTSPLNANKLEQELIAFVENRPRLKKPNTTKDIPNYFYGKECYSSMPYGMEGFIFATTIPTEYYKALSPKFNETQLRWIEALKSWIGFEDVRLTVNEAQDTVFVEFLKKVSKPDALYCLTTLRRIFEFYEQIHVYFDFIDYLLEEEEWSTEEVEENKEFLYQLAPAILFYDKKLDILSSNNSNHADLYLHTRNISTLNLDLVDILPESKRIREAFPNTSNIFSKFKPIRVTRELLINKTIKEILEYVKSV